MQQAVQRFVDSSYDGSGFHSINVISLCRHEVQNLEVKALTCHDDIGPRVKMDVGVSADIVELGLGTKRYEADRKHRWFTVYLRGNLINGLTGVEVLDTKEYHNGKFQKDNALDQFLVPYIYSASLEENADDFTEFYCDGAEYDGYKLPIHKTNFDCVDLTISGAADRIAELSIILKWLHEGGHKNILLEKTSKSAAFRIKVPKIEMGKPFETWKMGDLDACFEAIQELSDLAAMFAVINEVIFR